MSTLPSRLLTGAIALSILVPSLSVSQVKIKEKVEITPKPPSASVRANSSTESSGRFFDPPLFVWDSVNHQPALTLASTLTVQGTITFGADAGCGQQAQILIDEAPAIAWKGKTSAGNGCVPFEGQQTSVTGYSMGTFLNVHMIVFDWEWADAVRQLTGDDNTVLYSLSSYLRQGILPTSPPDVQVTGIATATGNIMPSCRFDHWELYAYSTVITCNGEMGIGMLPIDGRGYNYEPYGIPRSEANITVRVDSGGDYVFLRSGQLEGRVLNTTLAHGCGLVFDASRGDFPCGQAKVVSVTVMGGGRSATMYFTLICDAFHHVRVKAKWNELSPGQADSLWVIAENIYNQEVTFTEDFDVTFTLSSLDVIPGRWGPPPIGTFVLDNNPPEYPPFTVSYFAARAGHVKYLPDSTILGSRDSMQISITAEKSDDPSKYGWTDIEVKKPTLDHFDVTVSPDTIYYLESAKIKVLAKDSFGGTMDIGDLTPVNIVLPTDENVAVLQYYGAEGKELTSIPYCNARDEKVSVVAKGERPLGEVTHTVTIGVTKETKAGTGKVVVYNKFCQNLGDWNGMQYDSLVMKTKTKPKRDSINALGNLVYETVGRKGCALTCMAMIARGGGASIDPAILANLMRQQDGFTKTGGVKWEFINDLLGNTGYATDDDHKEGSGFVYEKDTINVGKSVPVDNVHMDAYLSARALIVALVYNPSTKNNHWVLVTGKSGSDYNIIDPGCYAGRTTLGGVYANKVYRIIAFEKQ